MGSRIMRIIRDCKWRRQAQKIRCQMADKETDLEREHELSRRALQNDVEKQIHTLDVRMNCRSTLYMTIGWVAFAVAMTLLHLALIYIFANGGADRILRFIQEARGGMV